MSRFQDEFKRLTPEQQAIVITGLEEYKNRRIDLMHPDSRNEEENGSLFGFTKQLFLGAVNEAALGAPRWIMDRNNAHLFKPSKSKGERIGRGIGTTLGFFLGAPMKVWGAATKGATKLARGALAAKKIKTAGKLTKEAVRGIQKGSRIAGQAGGFAAATAFDFPEKDEHWADKLIDVPVSAAVGAAFGFIPEAVGPVVKKNTAKVKKFFDGKLPKEQLKGFGDEFAKDMSKFDSSVRKTIDKLVESKQWAKANEIIQNTYTGAKKKYIDGITAIKHSKAYASTKEGAKKLMSSDYVTRLKANLEGFVDVTKNTELWKTLDRTAKKGWHNLYLNTGAGQFWNQNFSGKKIATLFRRITDYAKDKSGPMTVPLIKGLKSVPEAAKKNFHTIIEKGIDPGGALGNIANEWRDISFKFGVQLRKMGVRQWNPKTNKWQLFRPRRNYFPHQQIDDKAAKVIQEEVLNAAASREKMTPTEINRVWKSWNSWLKGNGKQDDAMVKFLVEKRGMKPKDAVETLEKIAKSRKSPLFENYDYGLGLGGRLEAQGASGKVGSIEYIRPVDLPFYDTNPERVLSRYIFNTNRRIAEIAAFGQHDEKLLRLLENMKKEGGDPKLAAYLIDTLSGKKMAEKAFGILSQEQSEALRGMQVITKLGLSSIANASQSVGTAMYTNIRDTAKNLFKYAANPKARKTMQEQALEWGVTMESSLSELMQGLGSDGSFKILGKTIEPSKFLKKTGFLAVERMNRVVSAHAAKDFLIRISKEYVANPKNKYLERTIRRLGVNPKSVLRDGGILDVSKIAKAARTVEAKTQFQSGLMDIPLWWHSPEGKLVTQFKVFSYKQAQLLKEVLIDEFSRGNPRPLITAMALMPTVGEGVKDARSILTLRKRNEKGLERLAENAAAVGAGGIFMDILQQAKFGNVDKWAMGPTISDTFKAVDAGIKLAKGKTTKAENMLLRNVPIAGPALMNLRRSSKSPDEKLKEILAGIQPK